MEILIPALPGFKKRLTRPWSLADYVDWLKKKGGKRAVFLGHSFGGRVALKLAAENPALVERLILVDAAGIKDKRILARVKRLVFRLLAKFGAPLKNIDILRRFVYFLTGERDYYRAKGFLRQTMANIVAEDLEPLLAKIKAPTLIVWGSRDVVTPLWMAYKIKSQIPNSKLQIIEDCGHSPHLEAPAALAKIIKQWLSLS